jgi:hypothetical protein
MALNCFGERIDAPGAEQRELSRLNTHTARMNGLLARVCDLTCDFDAAARAREAVRQHNRAAPLHAVLAMKR